MIERRYTPTLVEMRAGANSRVIGGYAAKFDRLSKNLGGFVERIADAAFRGSELRGWPDVLARYNHHDNMLLGTTAARTLRVHTDRVGLAYDVDVPDGRSDVLELVQRGDVTKSSFAFSVDINGDEWAAGSNGLPVRTLTSVTLYDVAPVNTPAYDDTSTGTRGALESLSRAFDADPNEVHRMATTGNLNKFFTRTDRSAHLALTQAVRNRR